MQDLIKHLKEEQFRINKLIVKTRNNLNGYDHGTLIKCKSFCYKQIRKEKKTRRIYLGKWDSEAVQKYKLAEMNAVRLKALEQNLILIEEFIQKYTDYEWGALNALLPPNLASIPLLKPVVDSAYSELKEWASENYEKNSAPFPSTEIYASDGTRVRSKGECLWYNALLYSGIPFRYDPVIFVTDEYGKNVQQSPDFLIMCMDGSLIAIEHMGMLGSSSYAVRNATKIQNYIRSGFVPGDNLILTSDSADGGFDSRVLDWNIAYIKQRILREPIY